ncbi:hypothetical protein AB0F03_03960 [Streptomyces sp. NPDC028722]
MRPATAAAAQWTVTVATAAGTFRNPLTTGPDPPVTRTRRVWTVRRST